MHAPCQPRPKSVLIVMAQVVLDRRKVDYIKSCQRDVKSPLKGRDFAHVTHFCMHNCGLRKNSPRHSVNCDQQCRRRRTTASQ